MFFTAKTPTLYIEISKSRSGQDLLAALQQTVKFFTDRGAPLLLVRSNNECAEVAKTWLVTKTITLELTPIIQHRTNKIKRAISIWKDHFIATLTTTNPNCSLSLGSFVDQVDLTLNFMSVCTRRCRLTKYYVGSMYWRHRYPPSRT